MRCRNSERAESARQQLLEKQPDASLHVAILDVSHLEGIARFCKEAPFERLDVLVHNAGILPLERGVSPEGLELTLATNLVGPLALTKGLLPQLERGENSRIVWVSSGGM